MHDDKESSELSSRDDSLEPYGDLLATLANITIENGTKANFSQTISSRSDFISRHICHKFMDKCEATHATARECQLQIWWSVTIRN
jgi:hypothetical protein